MDAITKKERVSVLRDDALYMGDNGRCFCGAHAGMTARYTGRDISGQKVDEITKGWIDEINRDQPVGLRWAPKCELPKCEVRA